MDHSQTDITICMGSSCFSRGNKLLLQMIREYLSLHGLDNKVRFKGAHCMKKCEHGPVIQINDKTYYKANQDLVEEILQDTFLSLNSDQHANHSH